MAGFQLLAKAEKLVASPINHRPAAEAISFVIRIFAQELLYRRHTGKGLFTRIAHDIRVLVKREQLRRIVNRELAKQQPLTMQVEGF